MPGARITFWIMTSENMEQLGNLGTFIIYNYTFTSCHGFAVPILSVPGLFYLDADFGLFAWLSLALWS